MYSTTWEELANATGLLVAGGLTQTRLGAEGEEFEAFGKDIRLITVGVASRDSVSC